MRLLHQSAGPIIKWQLLRHLPIPMWQDSCRTELAGYCRRKGIYVDEVKAWKEQCIKANQGTMEDPKELKESLKGEKNKVKKLEKELRIKEKALAETAALLVLRKKANAIWGDQKEE